MANSQANDTHLVVFVLITSLFAACGGNEAPDRDVPGSISGTVALSDTDDASGVRIQAAGVETRTPADGSFTLAGLPAREVTLTAEKDGYIPHSGTVTVPSGGTAKDQTITLQRRNEGPEIVEVTLEGSPLEPGESRAFAVRVEDPNNDEELSYSYEVGGAFSVEATEAGKATLTAPDSFGATATLVVEVSDDDGASDRREIDVETVGNEGPVIESMRAAETTLQPGGATSVSVAATDPDGDELSYSWSASGDWTLEKKSGFQARVAAPDGFGATGSVEVVVEDPNGESATASVTLETVENTGPRVRSVQANPPQAEPGGTVVVKVDAVDPDGRSLDIKWSGPADWKIASPTSRITEITAPDVYGARARISVTATDSEGETATGEVLISTPTNQGPRVTEFSLSNATVDKGQTIQAALQASDPNGDTLSYQWSATGGWSVQAEPAKPWRATITAPPTPGKTGYVEVKVRDRSGGEVTVTRTVSTRRNAEPRIVNLSASKTELDPKGTSVLSAVVDDPDGDKVTMTWSAPKGWTLSSTSGGQVTVTAPDRYDDVGVIGLSISDDYGGQASDQVVLKTRPNEAPVIQNLSVSSTKIKRTGEVSAEVRASDPNGESLSYTWSVSGNWTVQKDPSVPFRATVTAPNQPSTSTILRVKVEDGRGGVAEEWILVETKPNAAPKVASPAKDLKLGDQANPSPLSVNRRWAMPVEATDPDGDALSYTIKSSTSAFIDKENRIIWEPKDSNKGTHTMTLEVSDGFATVTRKLELKVTGFHFDFASPHGITEPDGVAWGHFNSDDWLDVVYVDRRNSNSADIGIGLGGPDGFKSGGHFTWDNRADYCVTPAVADVDSDGDDDVMVVCDYGNGGSQDFSYYVWQNKGNAKFTQGDRHYWNANDGYDVYDVALGDLDQDGDPEAVAAGRENVMLARNDGTGRFRSRDRWHDYSRYFYQVEIAELDGGGRPEIVVTYRDWGPDRGYVEVRDLGSGPSWGGRQWRYDFGRGGEHPDALGISDLDNDGDKDMVVWNDDNNDLYVFKNDGKANFSRTYRGDMGDSPPEPYEANALSFGDIDLDGNRDVLIGSHRGGRFYVGWGNGKADLTGVKSYSTPGSYNAEVWGIYGYDWEGDGDDDIVIGLSNGEAGLAR